MSQVSLLARQATCDRVGGPTPEILAAITGFTALEAEAVTWHAAGQGCERAMIASRGVQLVARRWSPDAGSGLVAQGDAGGLVRVVSGIVEEERFVPDGDGLRYEVAVLKAGSQSYIPRGGYRRLEAITLSVTVHAEPPAEKVQLRPEQIFAKLLDARRLRPRRRGGWGWTRRRPWEPSAA